MIGTRFLTATELSTHPAYKERMVSATENDSLVALAGNRAMGGAWRVLNNATSREVKRREAEGATDYGSFADVLTGKLTRDACYQQGDTEQGMVSMGPAIGFADRVEPLASIMARMMDDVASARRRIEGLWVG